ncbi:MAG: tetratricopeptide repeat protein [Planctomycetes bacterium]|nr:tetratricopeptide repeat protein [Planctomycetota bacterium]
MLRIRRRLPILASILFGAVACVSVPKDDSQAIELARRASAQGNWPYAMELWSGILEGRGGHFTEARMGLGEALLESDRALTAIRILRTEPPDRELELEYGLLLARAHFDQNQIQAGGLVLSTLLIDHADSREVLVLYGRSLLGGEQSLKGLGLLLQALRIDAGDGRLAEEVALRARALGQSEMEGEAWSHRMKSPNPPAEAYLGFATWILDQGESANPDPEAVGALIRASELDPQNTRVWARLGKLHADQGQTLEARQAYRRAVEVDPGNLDACFVLAQMYVALDDCDEAKAWIKHALGILTEDSERERFEELLASCEDA